MSRYSMFPGTALALAFSLTAAFDVSVAHAAWPDRVIRAIVPFAPLSSATVKPVPLVHLTFTVVLAASAPAPGV